MKNMGRARVAGLIGGLLSGWKPGQQNWVPRRFSGGSQATPGNAAVDVGPTRCDRKGHRGRKPGAESCSRCIGWRPYGSLGAAKEVPYGKEAAD